MAVGRRTAYRAARDYIDLGPANFLLEGDDRTIRPARAGRPVFCAAAVRVMQFGHNSGCVARADEPFCQAQDTPSRLFDPLGLPAARRGGAKLCPGYYGGNLPSA